MIEQIGGGWSIIVSGPGVPGAVGHVAGLSIDGGASRGDRVETLAPRLVFRSSRRPGRTR